MVSHCGREWDTPYCGECGTRLEEYFSGIQGLKKHVDGYVKSLAASLEELPAGDLSNKKEKLVNKWQSWQKALNELIENDTSK